MSNNIYSVVVIGASFSGLPVSHSLLKENLPKVFPSSTYKLTLINPTDEFLWKIGAPRVIANPTSLPLDKALLKFLPTFSKYGDRFEFVQGYVTAIDHEARLVTVGEDKSVKYDSLVIASGTHFSSDLWSTTPGSERLRKAIKEVHDKIPNATSILVAGGGPAGVETTGEFGESYGKTKEVTLLSGSEGLLYRLQNKSVGKSAQQSLEKQGVKVINGGVRVKDVKIEGGKYVLTLTNDEVKTVDIYVDATGDKPNSSFVPKEWLDDKGKVKTDGQTLRLDVPGVKGVYCIGTVASYSDGSVFDTKFAYPAVVKSIELDIRGEETGPRSKNVYKKFTSDMQLVPIGSTGGVGTAMGWKLPSLVVRLAKARDYMIGNAPKLVEGNA